MATPQAARRGGWRPGRQPEAYLFLLPSLAGFLLFTALPVLGSLALSFAEWNLLRPPRWVGLSNYAELLGRDQIFWAALGNTLFFTVAIVPLQLAVGLALALLLDRQIRGRAAYRVIYFMPVVSSVVAAALVFQWLFNRDFGLLSAPIWWLADRGVPVTPPDWLGSGPWARWAVVLLTVWKNAGFTMVIYLAALQAVPRELYEAARVDGASGWQRLRAITVPMVSPTTFFLLVIQMIGAFQLFSEPYVLTRGGPANATTTIVYAIFQNAFEFGRMGKAAAAAWVLFAFIFVFTLLQTRLQRRWVYYEAER
jgi:multiple sugar transport system permease protein